MLSVGITFSEWLQKEIDEREWSWNKLAENAGLSSGTIYNIRDGTRGVGESSLKAIAGALRYPVETVYRAAKFLPSSSELNEAKEELNYLFDQLPPLAQKEVLEWLRFKMEQEGKQETKKKTSTAAKAPCAGALLFNAIILPVRFIEWILLRILPMKSLSKNR